MTLQDKAVEVAADMACHLGLNASENEVRRLHDAIMATYAAAGWKLTPREATPDMAIVGGIAWCDAVPDSATAVDPAAACWSAMHDAAPSPEEAE